MSAGGGWLRGSVADIATPEGSLPSETFVPYVEQFISDLTIEAFDVAVLPGAAACTEVAGFGSCSSV